MFQTAQGSALPKDYVAISEVLHYNRDRLAMLSMISDLIWRGYDWRLHAKPAPKRHGPWIGLVLYRSPRPVINTLNRLSCMEATGEAMMPSCVRLQQLVDSLRGIHD